MAGKGVDNLDATASRSLCSASDLVGEGRHTGSIEYVQELGQRPRGSPIGQHLSSEFSDDRLRCEVKQVEEEGVGVDNLESKRLDALVGKVAGVEGDDRTGIGSHRGRENVAVFGVAGQPVNERLVPGHFGVRERSSHLSEQMTDSRWASYLDQVPSQFLNDLG